MFENLCTYPVSSHIFAQALHPTGPVFAVGLAGGHVESFRLSTAIVTEDNSINGDEMDVSLTSTGTSTINTQWRTRRHRGSCRSLAYSPDGEALYSSGTDGIIKAASSQTGRVFAKCVIPSSKTDSVTIDEPCLLHALSPQTLILATDSAALHIFDLRQPASIGSKPAQTHQPHDDYVTSLTPLPPTASSTSGFSKQWVSTGGSNLAVTDLRRGILSQSEDQEEELLSSVFVSGLPFKPGKSKGEKLVVGDSNGFLTLWDRGFWEDQQERIKVFDRKSNCRAIESLALIPDELSDGCKNVIVGIEDGNIRIVNLGSRKVVSSLQHDEVDGVVALGFDVERRLISSGGMNIKVWQESVTPDNSDSEEKEDERINSSDSFGSSDEDSLQQNIIPSVIRDDSNVDEELNPRMKSQKMRKKFRLMVFEWTILRKLVSIFCLETLLKNRARDENENLSSCKNTVFELGFTIVDNNLGSGGGSWL